jgi:hypothetical protein
MNFIERMIVKKEVNLVMKAFAKKFGVTTVHVVAGGIIFLAPSVDKFLSANPKYAGLGMLIWATVLHWAQSPKAAQ